MSDQDNTMHIDPVCGMGVSSEEFSVEYQDVLYAFCSNLCKLGFLQQPGIYIDMQVSRIKERNKELEFVRSETIQCLSRAAEYKDNETGEHILRMASYCKRLAVISGLDMKYAGLMEAASPMHDIGKIGTPEHILLKQGPLDADERRVMQQHPEIGAEIIGGNLQSELMKMAFTISLTHHEKWDGSGYPKGLKADEIPIEGRIVGICDVFDALKYKRPYKPAWPVGKIKKLIAEQKGKHFDPALAALFLDNFSDFLAICNCRSHE
jgi:putative two-component system response regulator